VHSNASTKVNRLGARGLKIALVHDWLTVPGGSEDVFREICDLYDGDIFTSQWDSKRIRFLQGRAVHTSVIQRLPLALKKHYLYAPLLPYVYRRFPTSDFDVILSDSHSFAHQVPKAPGALHVNYFHTPARSLWLPEIDSRASSGAFAPIKRIIASRLRVLDREAACNPDVVFANSQTTAERIRRFYGREVDAVIYPPVDTTKWADVVRESDECGFLMWGRLIDYKRFDLAIEFAHRTGYPLQIVGSGPAERKLKEQACGSKKIVFHGRLTDADLKGLMGRCCGVLFPGYEDFGIVPVEAMAAGLPVIAFGQGGAAETVRGPYGEIFDEQTVESLAAAVRRFEGRTFDPDAQRTHASMFDSAVFRSKYEAEVECAISRHFDPLGGSRRDAYAL
jgi:glycosyltransferase involved in cell wall biosynthesis